MTDVETPHELVLVNRYDASPEQVWAAGTDLENFVRWYPPDRTVSDVVMEVQPRGRFQQTQASPDGEMVVPFAGFYREAVAPGRLVFTLSGAPSPDDEARTVLTRQLRAVNGGTEQEFRQAGVVSDEHFQALKTGTEMFFTRLGEFLAR